MKRRLIAVMILWFGCMMLSGCWSRIELNELAITSATSIDIAGDDYIVSYQVIIPSAISSGLGMGGGGNNSPVVAYSTKGRTIRDANAKSFSESPRKLYFAHNGVIILSEETARRGLNPILDVYFRNPDARETVDVLITSGKSRKIIEQMMQIQKIPGSGIRDINRLESKYTSVLPEVNIFKLAMNLASDSGSALLPEVLISGEEDTSSLQDFQNTTLPSKIRMGRLAVIKNDKMIGWLSRKEALGVAFLRNAVNQTTITTRCLNNQKNRNTFVITQSATKLHPVKNEKGIVMNVSIDATAMLTETECSSLELFKPEVIRQMEQQAEKEVIALVDTSWKALQSMNTDAVQFADLIHRSYRKDWKAMKKDWDSEFAKITIKPTVKLKIGYMGLSNRPINVQELREKEQ
ncbi:MAG: Ger(x)C family spore germination protein [Candidatus Pristimantibacillus sp.]